MKEDETKGLGIDLTAVLRQLSVLERELGMVNEEIGRLNQDVKSGNISETAAEKLKPKFIAESESLRSAIRKVLEESIKDAKKIEETLKKKLKEFE